MLTDYRPHSSLQWLCLDCPSDRYRVPTRKKLPHQCQHTPHSLQAHHVMDFEGRPTCCVTTNDIRISKPEQFAIFPPNNYSESKIKAYSNHWQAPYESNKGVFVKNRMNYDVVNSLKYFTGLRNISVRNNDVRNYVLQPNKDCDGWEKELHGIIESCMNPILSDGKTGVIFKKRPREPRLETPKSGMYSSSGRLVRSSTGYRSCSSSSRSRIHSAAVTNRSVKTPILTSRKSSPSVSMNTQEIEDSRQDFERQIFFVLGGILQTQDPEIIKTWLLTATEREKALICDIVRSAIVDQEELKYFVGEAEKDPVNRLITTPSKIPASTNLETISEEDVKPNEINRLVVDKSIEVHPKDLLPTARPPTARPPTSEVFKISHSDSRPQTSHGNWIPLDSVA